MKAVVFTEPGDVSVLKVVDRPLPEPAADEIRIRVEAATVNPVDVDTRRGKFHGRWFKGTPELGLGWDVAGRVDALGRAASGFTVGDRVMAMNDRFSRSTGAYAQYITVPATAVAFIPAGLSMQAAATLPMNVQTADQSLNHLALRVGQRVLITGASAAVGGFAAQLAVLRGWHVTALASAGSLEEILSWGVHEVVLRGTSMADLGQFDGVLDAAQAGPDMIAAVRDGGSFVAVSPMSSPKPERGIVVHDVRSSANGPRLNELGNMMQAGLLAQRIAGALPLDQAAEAHRRFEAAATRKRWILEP